MGYNKNTYENILKTIMRDQNLTREQFLQREEEIRELFQQFNERSVFLEELQREVNDMNRRLQEIQQYLVSDDEANSDIDEK